jgi:flagellar hook-associated protein 1 FlgK
MSLFNILGTGTSGLLAAQQALNVVGQNVANASTPGYSRQRVDQATLQSNPTPGLYTGFETQINGVKVTTIERIKNAFLQATASNALARQSSLQGQLNPLNSIQTQLSEPSDTGLQATLDTFYAAWGTLANNPTPSNTTAGVIVLNTARAVTSGLNTLAVGVAAEWQNQRANLSALVTQVNDAATTVAQLNGQIVQGQVGGLNVNDLMDKRDQAVNTLASLVGANAATGVDGQVSVAINGVSLVSAGVTNALRLTGGADITVAGTDPPTLMIGAVVATPSLGTAAGALAALRTDLPSISGQLDGIANSLRDAVNGIQTTGFTLAGAAGTDFFSPTSTGARDLTVALTSSDEIAVSSSAGSHDGSNALKVADLADDNTATAALGGNPGPSERWRTLTSGLGTQIQGLNTALTSQTAIVASTQNAVDTDSGVNLDEEMTNMLLYQRSYQASAKIIVAADEMLQTVIGMVR